MSVFVREGYFIDRPSSLQRREAIQFKVPFTNIKTHIFKAWTASNCFSLKKLLPMVQDTAEIQCQFSLSYFSIWLFILHPPSLLLFSRTEKVLVLSKSVIPEVSFLYCFPPYTAACCCFTNIHFIKSCDKDLLDTRKMVTKLMDSPSQFLGAWMGDHWPSHCDQQSLFYFESEILNTHFVKLFLSCCSGAQGPALYYSKPTGVFLSSAVHRDSSSVLQIIKVFLVAICLFKREYLK